MVPQFEPLGHIPLLIHWPGVEGGGVCEALTTAVDLHATLADVFGVSPQHRTHGHSLAPLLRGAVLVNPTRASEGFQLTLPEALAAGGRVVTYAVAGVGPMVQTGLPVRVVE